MLPLESFYSLCLVIIERFTVALSLSQLAKVGQRGK